MIRRLIDDLPLPRGREGQNIGRFGEKRWWIRHLSRPRWLVLNC
jgi:hypothetical protein